MHVHTLYGDTILNQQVFNLPIFLQWPFLIWLPNLAPTRSNSFSSMYMYSVYGMLWYTRVCKYMNMYLWHYTCTCSLNHTKLACIVVTVQGSHFLNAVQWPLACSLSSRWQHSTFKAGHLSIIATGFGLRVAIVDRLHSTLLSFCVLVWGCCWQMDVFMLCTGKKWSQGYRSIIFIKRHPETNLQQKRYAYITLQ